MAHRTGQNRLQFGLFATPLDELIAPDNMVRVIDAFVDAIDLDKLGFVHVTPHKKGAPPYHPALLLKLYIYGYLNRVRSSRRLELECSRNIELFWLTGCQKPSYHTISDFRSVKPHRKALKATFRLFNQVLDSAAASHAVRHGRHIDRNIYEESMVANRVRVLNNRSKYKRRQAIVEHPFGTIKRSWGYYYTLLKGKEKLSAEYSLVFLAYNLRRAMSILGAKDLLKRVKAALFNILVLSRAVERQNWDLNRENFGVVWRASTVQGMRWAA